MNQYVTTTFTYESTGGTVSTSMVWANYATRGPYTYRKWYNCTICGFDYPEDEVILRGGLAYCLPRHDDEETSEVIQGRKRYGRLRRSRASRR